MPQDHQFGRFNHCDREVEDTHLDTQFHDDPPDNDTQLCGSTGSRLQAARSNCTIPCCRLDTRDSDTSTWLRLITVTFTISKPPPPLPCHRKASRF